MTKELSEKGKRDLLLINRALETGDTKAYNELMRLYRDPLYFMLFEKVGNEEIAKDLTIEALGKAFKKLHLMFLIMYLALGFLPLPKIIVSII